MKTGYLVRLSYEDEFVDLMSKLKSKYHPRIFEIQGLANENLDINAFSKNFFGKAASKNVAGISVDPNSNISEMNVAQWTYEHPKGISRLNSLYLMWDYIKKCYSKEEADEVIESILNGSIFVNDGHQFERPYCFGFDLSVLCEQGLNFFKGLMPIKAPKRADSFVDLLIQATAYLSNQIAGATSYPTLFVNFDWYLKKDLGENYIDQIYDNKILDNEVAYKVSNYFQKLIYSWGFPFRGSQSPFVNVSIFDKGFLNSLFGLTESGGAKYINPDGTAPDIESIYKLQKFFYEYFDSIFGVEGIFTFPVTTLAISIEETSVEKDGKEVIKSRYIDPDFVDWVSNVYPNKCIANIYVGQPNSFSSCCRMKNDYEKMDKAHREYQNSFGVGGISIGSTRVAGLNLPRIAFELKREHPNRSNFEKVDILKHVEKYLSLCRKVLVAHRVLLNNHIEVGALPLYTSGWIDIEKQYITYGIIGAYELLDILGMDVTTNRGSDYLVNVLKFIEDTTNKWSAEDKIVSNIEQIPGESISYRLANVDKELGYNVNYQVDLYSNQYVPLIKEASLYDRFKIQGKMDRLTSGGSILHLNIHDGAELTSGHIKKFIETARKTGTTYFAINRVFVKCENGHMAISNNGSCPICKGKIIEQYTRVVGFCVPVKSWSPIRREKDFPNRVFYQSNDRLFG